MIKRTILLAALLLVSCLGTLANPVHQVKLADGTAVGIEVCADGIFHVQISPSGTFSETLMTRYGITRSDWPEVDYTLEQQGGAYVFKSAKACLTLSQEGVITLQDAEGKTIVRQICFLQPGSAPVKGLADAINQKFADLFVPVNNGIIGDDEGKLSGGARLDAGNPEVASGLSLTMEDGERFYGGGSTSREHIQHRGELLRMWTTYQHTEIPMPFMMSSRGWGIFNNTSRKCHFDVGYTNPDAFNIYNTFPEADFYLMLGTDMPSILNLYTQITGRSYVLPRWAYGFAFGPNMREDQWAILNDAAHFREMGVPVDLFWLEPQWMAKRYDFSTQKKWNYDRFSPEPYWVQDQMPKKYYPRLFVGKLNSMGIRLGLWLCEEYDASIIEEDLIAVREGRDTSGLEHWPDHLTTFMDMGVAGFKLDPARTIDAHPTWNYHNGHGDDEMHNISQVLMPKQIAQMTRRHTGKRSWHHYCGGWAGSQHWSAANSGDNGGGIVALFDQHNLGNSGFMNMSCDVMSVPREQEMPGLHFGVFLPWLQVNSWFSMMQPFYYHGVEKEMYKFYIGLRYSFIPYIYSNALEGMLTGMPMVRSMPLEFPDDRNCDDMVFQYMFGRQYCVSAFSNDIYLPAGEWINVWTGELVESRGETISRELPHNRAGQLFVRGESYAYEEGAVCSTLFECHQSGKGIRVTVNPVQGTYEGLPESRNYSFELRCTSKPRKVSLNGTPVKDWSWENNTLQVNAGETSINETLTLTVQL